MLFYGLSSRDPEFGNLRHHLDGQRRDLARLQADLSSIQVRRQGCVDIYGPDAVFPAVERWKDSAGLFGGAARTGGPPGESIYRMSVVRHEGFDWSPLSAEESGPRDRDTNVVDGCAGYVAVFPSGETLVSCNIDLKFSLKIGDCTGRRFNGRSWAEDWFQPFPRKGFWGSLELLDSHRVIGAMHGDEGIQLGVFYLNHRIDAPFASTMPGDRDWWDNQALFIGGDSPAYACFRGCYDEEFFHLFVEYGQCPEDFAIDMMLGSLPLTIDASGLVGAGRSAGCLCLQVPEYDGSGSLLRISVPRRLLKVHPGDTLRFNAILRSREIRDTFTFADASDPETWMNIVLR